MNPLDIILKETNKNGVQVEVTRQRNGVLEPARPQELATLSTKSRIASTAQLLQRLTKEEKLEWAIETKDEGNALFQEQKYAEAMEKYVEALSATDFGSKEEEACGNVDVLVIPTLCNLAACCIQLEQWAKAVLFCDQALKLRPHCQKAHYRRAIGLLNVGEYSECITLLRKVNSTVSSLQSEGDYDTPDSNSSIALSEKEIKRIPYLLTAAIEKLRKEKEFYAKQKESLQKAFQKDQKPIALQAKEVVENESKEQVKLMSFFELFWFFFEYLYHIITTSLFDKASSSSSSPTLKHKNDKNDKND